jgi:hypothetical protein
MLIARRHLLMCRVAASGINRPLILNVLVRMPDSTACTRGAGPDRPAFPCAQGTDGRWYKQLVKSADDLRQDAVMEQVGPYFAQLNVP